MKSLKFLGLAAALLGILTGGTLPAGATGAYAHILSGCTTVLPLFPSPAGAAPVCGAPTGATTVPLPTDGVSFFTVGGGVDDANNLYAFDASPATGVAGATATVPSYSEPCVAGEPSAVGLANGVLTLSVPASATIHVGFPGDSAQIITDYAWVRVGLQAIIRTGVLAGGGGVTDFAIGPDDTGVPAGALTATLVPIPPLGTCAAPLPLEVHVVSQVGALTKAG